MWLLISLIGLLSPTILSIPKPLNEFRMLACFDATKIKNTKCINEIMKHKYNYVD